MECRVNECCQQTSTVEYVHETKRLTPFIAADGHAETPPISESSRHWCSVVNIKKLAWSKYVDNSKRRLCLYQLTGTPKRTERNLFVYALANLKPKLLHGEA